MTATCSESGRLEQRMGGLEEGGRRKGERRELCQKVEFVERLSLMIFNSPPGE